MRRRRRGLTLGGLMALLAIIAVAVVLYMHFRPQGGATKAKEGQSLFTLQFAAKDIDDGLYSTGDHLGRVVLVNVFATWCGPCVRETPHLVQLYEKHHDEGLDVVMVSLEPAGKVKAFREQQRIPFAMIADGRAIVDMIPGFRGFPTTVALDKSGNVRRVIVGADLPRIHEAVNTLLAE